jgi:hypothetical protein
LLRDGSTGRNVVSEFIFAKILASGLKEAEIMQIRGETNTIPISVLPK